MDFASYFDAWLNEGYYKAGVRVGKSGDFYTAVSVGELFGGLIAKHLAGLIEDGLLKLPASVVEIGANEGYLFKDVLSFLPKDLASKLDFFIIEPHLSLRKRQKEELKAYKITQLESLKDFKAKNAFIFANELFDCFPPQLLKNGQQAFVKDHKIYFKKASKELLDLAKLCELECGELSLFLQPFLAQLKASVKDNLRFACFDYFHLGPSFELSLRIYKNHQLYDPFKLDLAVFFAKSDITYNVNLAQFKLHLSKLGFELFDEKRQGLALVDFKLHELIDEAKDKNRLLLQAKNLIFGFDEKYMFLEFGY